MNKVLQPKNILKNSAFVGALSLVTVTRICMRLRSRLEGRRYNNDF